MHVEDFRRVIRRELKSLHGQLGSYDTEERVWELPDGVRNSAGTLCLHLCGNLQHFISAQLGGTGYVRDRDAEFSRRGVPRAELSELITECAAAVDQTLAGLEESRLQAEYPMSFAGGSLRVHTFLLHLVSHLAYHLGQIDMHRRLTCRQAGAVATVNFDGLFVALEDPFAQES
jgi:uncharacterized damage-inducible protein DinB